MRRSACGLPTLSYNPHGPASHRTDQGNAVAVSGDQTERILRKLLPGHRRVCQVPSIDNDAQSMALLTSGLWGAGIGSGPLQHRHRSNLSYNGSLLGSVSDASGQVTEPSSRQRSRALHFSLSLDTGFYRQRPARIARAPSGSSPDSATA